MNGYLYFTLDDRSVRVAFFQGTPCLFAEFKAGFLPFDKKERWRSIFSKRKQKEILDFMNTSGLIKDLKETVESDEKEKLQKEKRD